jgi:hypothetical protein
VPCWSYGTNSPSLANRSVPTRRAGHPIRSAVVEVHVPDEFPDRATAGDDRRRAEHTVKDLVVGSGLAFTELGTYPLRGAPGEWRLYAVQG